MRPEPTGRGASRVAPRPRYGRITAAAAALLVTLVSVLGGLGVLPGEQASARSVDAHGNETYASTLPSTSTIRPSGGAIALADGDVARDTRSRARDAALPEDSGTGRRIVFDMARQRVWLVGQRAGRDVVRRTYLVSGSVTDNLKPGTYSVYSKSRQAWGVDDSGTMRYMVRFARGDRAAIGFHDIPVSNGSLVQTRAELGSPRSHGCIRQWRPDAQALWAFTPLRTKVVVT